MIPLGEAQFSNKMKRTHFPFIYIQYIYCLHHSVLLKVKGIRAVSANLQALIREKDKSVADSLAKKLSSTGTKLLWLRKKTEMRTEIAMVIAIFHLYDCAHFSHAALVQCREMFSTL